MEQTRWRTLFFITITGFIGLLMFLPLKGLLYSKSGDMYYEYYSHIYLIPLVSAYLLFNRREEIWKTIKTASAAGLSLAALGIIGYGAAKAQGSSLTLIDAASWQMASLLTAWLGAA